MKGQVVLVGAGCGSGLITLRGLAEIRRAEVLVYDDLLDDALVAEVPADCRCIYVGKRSGRHSMKQDEINALLIKEAEEGNYVVRLKGGDSFVFGRGGEEYLALEERGIACRMVPGVTSSVAVPESLGIPVTHRGVAQSFTVITGHTAAETEEDYNALAQLKGTLVFLMGLSAVGEISEKLIAGGKDPATPAAILSRGFRKDALRIDGTLADIASKKDRAKTPAIFVVGPTAGYHMVGRDERPLAGISVAATGTPAFVEKTGAALAEAGADAVLCPTLELTPIEGSIPADLSAWDWVCFTSANGIELFFDHLKEQHIDLRTLAGIKFACIGRGTEEKLAAHGIHADLVPEKYTAGDLGKALATAAKPEEKILILRAEKGSPLLTEALDEAGLTYEDCKIYRTLTKEADVPEADYLVFGSASGVRAFCEGPARADGEQAARAIPEGMTAVCIGDYTANELKKYPACRMITAKTFTADGIIAAIEEDRGKQD
ncbi:MAG: uroporphyrinogen-III C-methyltransferase [Clostridiales bacterium]|nr:uroporphyrinogen-III C-methyltransferase [Clostridiales bacterium]